MEKGSETDRQTGRQAGRLTDRQTNRQAGSQTDRLLTIFELFDKARCGGSDPI